MAEISDIFARVQGYQQQSRGRTLGDLGQYGGRLQQVRDAYQQRLDAERMQSVGEKMQRKQAAQFARWGGGGIIDRFMAAIGGQESGGNYNASNDYGVGHQGKYQISSTNWPVWAAEAGLGSNAPMSPANQERVARHKMQQYYNQTGRWDLVARMWYAGPGSLNYSDYALNRPQGGGKYPSINDYVQAIMARMGY